MHTYNKLNIYDSMFGTGARSFLDLDRSASFCIIYVIQKIYTPDLQKKVMLTLVLFYFLIIIIY